MTRRMSRAQKLWIAERAIVLQVLRDDHAELWRLEELEQEVSDLSAESVRQAIRRLGGVGVGVGVLVLGEGECKASRATRRIDALGLVSI